MRHHLPKQLIKIAGRPIIEHTLEIFEQSADIDEVLVLMAKGYADQAKAIVKKNGFKKVSQVLEGGSTRNETTKVAIHALDGQDCNVLFHDAVRPLLSQRIIRGCVDALEEYQAVDVAIASADTIIEVEDDVIKSIPDRTKLRRGQTPQGFHLSTIKKAYELWDKEPDFQATDDCGVVKKFMPEVKIAVVEGSEQNIKITHPLDTFLADKLFQLSSAVRLNTMSDSERKDLLSGRTMVVFGGSYGIGADMVELAERYGARVFAYSRSGTGTDVTKPGDVKQALKEAHKKAGRIDYVVNTAGLLEVSPLEKLSDEQIDKMIRTNYQAPVIIAKSAFPYLKKSRGQLLLFTSSSYTRGRAEYSIYTSSKAGVVNLTQALADEWSDDKIRINCINPERAATPMRTKAFGKEDSSTLLPSDIVAAVSIDVLLDSLTGQVVDVRLSDLEELKKTKPRITKQTSEALSEALAKKEADES